MFFFQRLGLFFQKGFQIDCRSLHLFRTGALMGDVLALESSQMGRTNRLVWRSLALGLSNFSFFGGGRNGKLVVWTSLTLYRILEDCLLVVPIGPPALAALTGHCPWFFRSPRPLHSNVYCLRGSHYHSGE